MASAMRENAFRAERKVQKRTRRSSVEEEIFGYIDTESAVLQC